MAKRRYYIDYNKTVYACSVEWNVEVQPITSLEPFINYIRCDLNGEDYAFLNSGEGDFEEVELVNFEACQGGRENIYTLCYTAWIVIDLEHHPKFKKALTFSSDEIEAVIGFKYGDEVIENCYEPISDYAVPLIEDVGLDQNKINTRRKEMTTNIGDLKGPILEGKCEILFFSEDDWQQLFKKKGDVKEWFANNCNLEEDFSPTDIVFDGVKNNLLIRKGKKIIAYSWNFANGPHPDRWQDRDDFTDWFSGKLNLTHSG
tara:strand:+ start:728 stop:1504 length:777 start_codon:yes stop_codon:yes gene_type:complete